jgi:leader peptidase (prepilin peptidase)/N-methyltransferase
MMAAFLGRTVSVALIGGLLFAALPSLVLVAVHGRKGAKMSLALGPFLAAGGVTALLFGTQLLDWYFGRGA